MVFIPQHVNGIMVAGLTTNRQPVFLKSVRIEYYYEIKSYILFKATSMKAPAGRRPVLTR